MKMFYKWCLRILVSASIGLSILFVIKLLGKFLLGEDSVPSLMFMGGMIFYIIVHNLRTKLKIR